MKVIGINGSARKDGNTAILIRKVFEELNNAGIETELIQLADKEIQPCRGCFACKGQGNCAFKNDYYNNHLSKTIITIIISSKSTYTSHPIPKKRTFAPA